MAVQEVVEKSHTSGRFLGGDMGHVFTHNWYCSSPRPMASLHFHYHNNKISGICDKCTCGGHAYIIIFRASHGSSLDGEI